MQLFFLSRTVSEWRVVNEMSENGFILPEKELHIKFVDYFTGRLVTLLHAYPVSFKSRAHLTALKYTTRKGKFVWRLQNYGYS